MTIDDRVAKELGSLTLLVLRLQTEVDLLKQKLEEAEKQHKDQ